MPAMARLQFGASAVWGALLALFLFGAGFDGSPGLIVYFGSAFVALALLLHRLATRSDTAPGSGGDPALAARAAL